MEVTDVKITKADQGAIKAWGSIVLDGELVIHGIRVIETDSKKFVGMPSRKTKDDKFLDVCHPITQELRNTISEAVLKAYDNLVSENTDF